MSATNGMVPIHESVLIKHGWLAGHVALIFSHRGNYMRTLVSPIWIVKVGPDAPRGREHLRIKKPKVQRHYQIRDKPNGFAESPQLHEYALAQSRLYKSLEPRPATPLFSQADEPIEDFPNIRSPSPSFCNSPARSESSTTSFVNHPVPRVPWKPPRGRNYERNKRGWRGKR